MVIIPKIKRQDMIPIELKGSEMQELPQFLSALRVGIDRLEQRAKTIPRRGAAVAYLPNQTRSVGKDEIAVGTGQFEFVRSEDQPARGICLCHKTACEILNAAGASVPPKFGSETEFVLNAPPALLAEWRSVVGDDASPERFFERFSLVVEDASPDSCFGLLCLLMRLNGISTENIPDQWVSYIDGWERGNVTVGESAYCAYGPLHNALVHASFNPERGQISNDEIAVAWVDGLRLMGDALTSERPPLGLPLSLSSPAFLRARAMLRFEEQEYEENLSDVTLLELSLPIAQTRNRYRLVDAFLSDGIRLSGSLKVFLRNDRSRPYLKNGFTVMAIHPGPGEEMSISLDEQACLDLSELWLKLEQAEDRAWGQDRPHDSPRKGIVGYPEGRRLDGSPAPNQPWYDGGDYTLLASPHPVSDKAGHAVAGTKLEWPQVLDLLWQTYQPFRHVSVVQGIAATGSAETEAQQTKHLEDCYCERLQDGLQQDGRTPRLFIAFWSRPDNTAPAFNVTPTLCRYLAACVQRWRPASAGEPVKLAELVDESAYAVLRLRGMVAVITTAGAFLLYNRQRSMAHIAEIKREFENAVRIKQRIERSGGDLARFLDDIKAYYEGRRRDFVENELLEQLTREHIDISLELQRVHAAVRSTQAQQFRDALLTHWGLQNWLGALASDIAQIKNVLYGRAGLDAARHFEFLRRYVVPVALAAIFYGICAASIRLWTWSADTTTLARLVVGLALLAALSLINYSVLEWMAKRRRRARVKSAVAAADELSRPSFRTAPLQTKASSGSKPAGLQDRREAPHFAE